MPEPVIVYVDVTSTIAAESMTGIQRVTTEVVERLLAGADDYGLDVRLVGWTHWLKRWRRVPVWEFARGPGQAKTRRRIWWNRLRKLRARREELGGPAVFLDIDAAWQVLLPRARLLPELRAKGVEVVNVHYDLTPVLFPDYFAHSLLAVFEDFIRAEEQYATRIVCISKAVADELTRHAGRALPITVVPLGIDHIVRSASVRTQSSRRTLVHVGTIEPRKGIETVVAAFDRLAPEFDDLDLLLIGREGWKAADIAARVRAHREFGHRLRWIEGASDDVVARALADAFCVLVASRYEGYGLPVVEALARGAVVVSTNGGALGEVAPDLVDLVPVGDADAMAVAVRRYLVDLDVWQERRQRIEAWTPPSWDDTTTAIVRVIRSAASAE